MTPQLTTEWEIAVLAETQGLASAYCVEAARSALIPLAAIAQHTSRLRLGPYILNAYGRSPFLTVLNAIDFDELCGGRLVLCIGPGNKQINEAYQQISMQHPARKMSEYAHLVRMMLRATPNDVVSFKGDFHRAAGWRPVIYPRRPSIPVYLAAISPLMRRLAGRVADGIAMGVLCSPDLIRSAILPDLLAGAKQSGKSVDSVKMLMAYLVSVDDERETARTAMRRAICNLFSPLPHPYYEYLIREQGFFRWRMPP